MPSEQFLWVERFRPQCIDDVILPESIKSQFIAFKDNGDVPNLILAGGAGVGKTTVAKAILGELGCDYIIFNGSMDNGMETLRTDIKDFATTVSFAPGRKYIILDEADYLTPNMQGGLRNFMEEYSSNCGFILTCNFPDKIIDPLHSRCTLIDFKISKSESAKLAKQFMIRVKGILDGEGIAYEMKVLAEFIMVHFPDWRKILNELQSYSVNGAIDNGILKRSSDESIEELVGFLRDKNFNEMRKWVGESDVDIHYIGRKLYDGIYDYIDRSTIPNTVVIIADYLHKSAFAKDQEINTVAMLTELMSSVSFK
jgi:DNA polymerase III delta prime subunit